MEEIKPACSQIINDPLIVVSENRSKLTLINNARLEFLKIKVDGGQITDWNKPKCDYLFIQQTNSLEYFVELKGTDIKHAILQIESTIPRLSIDPMKQAKICFIIATVVSPKFNTQKQNAEKEFRKKYNAKLIIKNTPYSYTIE